MSIWLLASAAGIGYSAFCWLKRREAPLLSVARAIFWGVFAIREVWTNKATTILLFLALLIWIGAQLLVQYFKNKGSRRPLTEEEKLQRLELSEGDLRVVHLLETVKDKRLTIEEIRQELREMEERSAQSAVENAENEKRKKQALNEREALRVKRCDEWMDVKFHLEEASIFENEDGEEIELPAGEYRGSWRLSLLKESDEVESQAVAHSSLKFSTPDGRAWIAESYILLDETFDLIRLDADKPGLLAHWWSSANEQLRNVMRERCVIADLSIFNDNRWRFPVIVGDKRHCIMQKYLSWVVDVALAEDSESFVVRVADLYEEIYKGDVFVEGNHGEAVFDDMRIVPPFFYTLPVSELLPLPKTKYRFSTLDALDDWDGESESEPPLLKPA